MLVIRGAGDNFGTGDDLPEMADLFSDKDVSWLHDFRIGEDEGVTYPPKGSYRQRLVESRVRFKKLSDDEISAYLASGQWRGKAGGYAIQGLAGTFVVKIVGSYTGVVGLPLYETVRMLEGEGFPITFGWLGG